MHRVKPLPSYLVQRYQGWKATTYAENRAWYERLASEGQRPRAMIIGCCDSRINLNAIFGADLGEAFIHRNVANLVPPHEPDGEHHGTSAAVEYAVEGLRVAHVLVIGHTNCGGVKACYDMCGGHAPELERPESYVGRWMDILAPAYSSLPEGDEKARLAAFERAAVMKSLENLITFPFVDRAMNEGRLSIHGAVAHLDDGGLEVFDAADRTFAAI
jgi:carbonic anhydrase